MDNIDYDQLLTCCGEIGLRLLDSGAETYRVEDTVRRLLAAYGAEGNVFAIPTCLIVSVTDPEEKGHTWMRRLDTVKGADIEAIEQYNALSRSVCANRPALSELPALTEAAAAGCRQYQPAVIMLGYCICGAFFALFFQGGLAEALVAAAACLFTGLFVIWLDRLKVNFFFRTASAAVVLGAVIYAFRAVGVPVDTGVADIGALMVLVPGMIFTNFMCDLITGDSLSGTSTFIRAVLTAAAIALGVGLSLTVFQLLGLPTDGYSVNMNYSPAMQCLLAAIACLGCCIMYNSHGGGTPLCCLGSALGWAVYLAGGLLVESIYLRYLMASIVVSIYSEILARWRKYPTTGYRVVSFFPLVPGARIYYAMYYAIQGEGALFLEAAVQALGMAACLALGTLLVTTVVHTYGNWKSGTARPKDSQKIP